jgi:hypothetical protein
MFNTFLTCTITALLLFPFSLCGQNIEIAITNNPNEPSIAMDTANPAYLIAGANLNNYFVSEDTGRTWTHRTLQSSLGVWGDPCISVDTAGDFYFFHLSNPPGGNWIDRIVCQKTTDRGMTWNDGTFTGLNGEKEQDKEWCAIDPATNAMYLTWTQFDQYGSSNPQDSSTILFSKSLDAGATWSPALRINKIAGDCIDSDNTVEGAVPAVGPDGQLYVSWAGPAGLVFNKSYDGGESWLPQETFIDPMPTGWDYLVPGIFRANGLPVTTCDVSNSDYHGTIYVNWSDQRNGADDTDIWLSKSTDEGETWSPPVRVNDDPAGNQQFFTWMTIDQTNGYLYFVFYDRRDHSDSQTDVFVAVSKDGGETFTNRRISEEPFLPNPNIFFGDYTNIVAHNGIVRPIWTRLHNGALSIWTALLNEEDLTTSQPNEGMQSFSMTFDVFPNPSASETYVSYKLHEKSDVRLSILDEKGIRIRKLIDEAKGYGSYIEKIQLSPLNLTPGIYLLQLEVNGTVAETRKLIIQ